MALKRIDPREQFSKKLASRAEWFWFGYMVLLVVAIVITPDSSLPAVYLGIMVTGVMIVSVLAYTKNSIDEKGFFWLTELAKAVGGKSSRDDAGRAESGAQDNSGGDSDEEVGDNG